MRRTPFAFLCWLALIATPAAPATVLPVSEAVKRELAGPRRFDSDQGVGLTGEIPELTLYTEATTDKAIREQMVTQLFFLGGALNEKKSGAELGHADIKVLDVVEVPGTKLKAVKYSVTVLVGWHKSFPVPQALRMALPARADASGLIDFHGKFASTCSESAEDPDLSPESFYYYFRPEQESCSLFTTHADPKSVTYFQMKLSPSKLQTEGKFPEYGKVWEDGRLVATMIFGTNIEHATANNDAGVAAYNRAYLMFREWLGDPDKMNVHIGGGLFGGGKLPGFRFPDVEMEWRLNDGRVVNVNLLLVDKYGLIEAPEKFAKRYAKRTAISDFVSYNGHSGFGENIRALTQMGSFVKGQWQLFFVNGCDTFLYVDDSLRAAHADVNPGSTPYQFFDVITNAMPSPFNGMANANYAVVRAMVGKTQTYRQVLSQMAAMQHAIVIGEEDNAWTP